MKVIQMRRGRKYQCTKCTRTFVHIERAQQHVKDEHVDEDEDEVIEPNSDSDAKTKSQENAEDETIVRGGKRRMPSHSKSAECAKTTHEKRMRGVCHHSDPKGDMSETRVTEKQTEQLVEIHATSGEEERSEQPVNDGESISTRSGNFSHLECEACGDKFLEDHELLEHAATHHWTCTLCQVRF